MKGFASGQERRAAKAFGARDPSQASRLPLQILAADTAASTAVDLMHRKRLMMRRDSQLLRAERGRMLFLGPLICKACHACY